ncbi:MAG: SsrA-binding protein SmpB [Candidatus Riflebacteria bacterium]|nr:SsrA-binding protein SmpB [Candidatus Riflebacteria bacterium]
MKSHKDQDAEGIKLIASNKRAGFDYFIIEKLETGIVLQGSELKPCREGRVNLKDGFAVVEKGELWLHEVHIGANPFANRLDHSALRKRKLLAHARQINKLAMKIQTGGNTIVPLRMYFKNGRVKVEIALVKGKRQYDKRDTIAKKDLKRDMEQEMSGKKYG